MSNLKQILGCVFGCAVALATAVGAQTTTDVIAFQGSLSQPDSMPVPDGTYAITVRVTDAATGGDVLSTQSFLAVPVTGGSFALAIDGTSVPASAFAGGDLFVEIEADIDGDGFDADDVFAPRIPINAVASAFFARQAADAVTLGGLASADYVTESELTASQATQDAAITAIQGSLDGFVTEGELDASQMAQDMIIDSKVDQTVFDASQSAQNAEIALKANTADVDQEQSLQDAAIASLEAISGMNETAVQDLEATVADLVPSETTSYVIVEQGDTAVENGTNLLAAYATASALTPNGAALAATNRATVLVPPGQYDLGTGPLLLDTEFVDVVGVSDELTSQVITGTTNTPGTGVLRQTASSVVLRNLTVQLNAASGSGGGVEDGANPAAYYPDTSLALTRIYNCFFDTNDVDPTILAMRQGIEYLGLYVDCQVDDARAFGGGGGTASGRFERCRGADLGFGSGGTANGEFVDCVGGTESFAGRGGTASGRFVRCIASTGSFGGQGSAPGTFIDCEGGNFSFAGEGGLASGTFTNCLGGDDAFGGNRNGQAGDVAGTFRNCVGGDNAFGTGSALSPPAVLSGSFIDCEGGDGAFGANGDCSGTFVRCVGGDNAFGGFGNPANAASGVASGDFVGCIGGTNAFGGTGGSITNGTFTNCIADSNSFGGLNGVTTDAVLVGCRMFGSVWLGTFSGRMENCVWNSDIDAGAGARFYGTTFLGSVDLTGSAAGIAHCRVDGTIDNAGAAVFNTFNIESTDVAK